MPLPCPWQAAACALWRGLQAALHSVLGHDKPLADADGARRCRVQPKRCRPHALRRRQCHRLQVRATRQRGAPRPAPCKLCTRAPPACAACRFPKFFAGCRLGNYSSAAPSCSCGHLARARLGLSAGRAVQAATHSTMWPCSTWTATLMRCALVAGVPAVQPSARQPASAWPGSCVPVTLGWLQDNVLRFGYRHAPDCAWPCLRTSRVPAFFWAPGLVLKAVLLRQRCPAGLPDAVHRRVPGSGPLCMQLAAGTCTCTQLTQARLHAATRATGATRACWTSATCGHRCAALLRALTGVALLTAPGCRHACAAALHKAECSAQALPRRSGTHALSAPLGRPEWHLVLCGHAPKASTTTRGASTTSAPAIPPTISAALRQGSPAHPSGARPASSSPMGQQPASALMVGAAGASHWAGHLRARAAGRLCSSTCVLVQPCWAQPVHVQGPQSMQSARQEQSSSPVCGCRLEDPSTGEPLVVGAQLPLPPAAEALAAGQLKVGCAQAS